MNSDAAEYLGSQEEAASDQAHDVEASMLGLLICYAQDAPAIIRHVPAFYFHDLRHKEIIRAIQALILSDSYPDAMLVIQALKEAGKLELAGGIAYVSGLPDNAPPLGVFESYAAKLKEKANCRRLKSVVVVLSDLANKGSLSSPHLQDAREQIEYLLDKMDPSGRALPAIEDCHDILQHPPAKPHELVGGVLHQGTKMVFGGASKAYKTWTQLDLAVSVACGIPWWGFNTVQGRVLYVNFEVQDWGFYDRLPTVLRARGAELQPGALDHWCLVRWAGDVSEIIQQFIKRTCFQQYRLIILDPTYKLLGGRDENAAGDIGSLLNAFGTIAIETGAAVVFGSHFSKGNQSSKEAMDRISGSGVFARDPDTIVTMTAHEDPETFSVECKLRNLPPVEPFCVRWKYPLMLKDGQADPAKLKQPGGRPRQFQENELLNLLQAEAMDGTAWQRAALEELGVSRSTFFTLRRNLLKSGQIMKSKINEKWTLIQPQDTTKNVLQNPESNNCPISVQ